MTEQKINFYRELFNLLADLTRQHAHGSAFYNVISHSCEKIIADSNFAVKEEVSELFGQYGELYLPYFNMGTIDSLKLFGLDELILFSFYLKNRKKYSKVADMGANIGLHAILMSKLGWEVTAFEPDPVHVERLKYNSQLNNCVGLEIIESAISAHESQQTFTRILNNRTGSHIKGSKNSVYGPVEEFKVECKAFNKLMHKYDFIKMDIEGAEAEAIASTNHKNWEKTDVMLEVGSSENAKTIWNHITLLNLNAYSQKSDWNKAKTISDIPTSYKEGSLFITANSLDFPF